MRLELAIEKLNAVANRALQSDVVKTRYAELGADPVGVVKATGAHVD